MALPRPEKPPSRLPEKAGTESVFGMTSQRDASTRQKRNWIRKVAGLAVFLMCAWLVGRGVQQVGAHFAGRPEPAGFGQGMIQGALMPMSFPNLILGKDVIIYSERNNGIPYKLGYTLGVNLCGLIFFGLFFRRINRRKNGT